MREELPTLSSKAEAPDKPDQFQTFLEQLQGYVGSSFKNPKDLDPAINEPFTFPMTALIKELPTKKTVALRYGLDYDNITDSGQKETIDKLWNKKVEGLSDRVTTGMNPENLDDIIRNSGR